MTDRPHVMGLFHFPQAVGYNHCTLPLKAVPVLQGRECLTQASISSSHRRTGLVIPTLSMKLQ